LFDSPPWPGSRVFLAYDEPERPAKEKILLDISDRKIRLYNRRGKPYILGFELTRHAGLRQQGGVISSLFPTGDKYAFPEKQVSVTAGNRHMSHWVPTSYHEFCI
jgi:hypothetical protein